MHMHVQIERAPEPLDDSHRAAAAVPHSGRTGRVVVEPEHRADEGADLAFRVLVEL
jgi:hypothetical protein